ncbi:argininosuccinate synthetase [Laetiporus sulphureus 93-53]|uniref:argininosuccinate synthase n=1 Tax=Laetiporus sulphureus 93-53 TaxID=1314785 RepID=A0A165ENV1_9APHY|nr:argininosuccinate synthetase [Laetiporus sulphureus 93-53]KZT07452.1 argininosuccinate synthetase [Laetiporus sulphureus 93-53]
MTDCLQKLASVSLISPLLVVSTKRFFFEDLKRKFVTELIHPAVQANCIYENVYLPRTSLDHQVIACKMMVIADRGDCGKVLIRFGFAFYGLKPDIKVIAPCCQALLTYAAEKKIPVQQTTLITTPENAPDMPERISIHFEHGLPIKYTDAVEIFITLNALMRRHGIGCINIVENRFIGIKLRGCYKSPAATILRVAHKDIEGLALDRNIHALRDQFMTVELNSKSEFMVSSILSSQQTVNGVICLKLYKGPFVMEGQLSEEVLYNEKQSSMDELGSFEPTGATGFIQIESICIKKRNLLSDLPTSARVKLALSLRAPRV